GDDAPMMLVALKTSDEAHYEEVNIDLKGAWTWREATLPENAKQIYDLAIGNVGGETGVFVLYDTADGQSLTFSPGPYDFELQGDAQCIAVLPGEKGSDLYVGGDGIYLFKEGSSQRTQIAGAKEISNVSELIVKQDSQAVAVWAIHGDEELTYQTGDRRS